MKIRINKKMLAMAVLLSIVVPATTKAVSVDTSVRPQPIKAINQNIRDDRREAVQTRIEDRKDFQEEQKENREAFRATLASSTPRGTSTKEMRQDFLQGQKENRDNFRREEQKKLGDLVAKRFVQAIAQLKDIAARIETRLQKIESSGGNTTLARKAFVEAQDKVNLADASVRRLLDLINAQYPTATTSTSTIIKNKDIKSATDKATKDIKTAGKALEEVIKAARPKEIERKERATSTATSTKI